MNLTEQRATARQAAERCANARSDGLESFAGCWMERMVSGKQAKILECIDNNDDAFARAVCAAKPHASDDLLRAASCVKPGSSAVEIARCMGVSVIPPEAARVANCLRGQGALTWTAAVCAGGGFITQEQRVFADCAVRTGLVPLLLIGCVAQQNTINELQKCIDSGIGGNGCFGPTNSFVEFATNAWSDIRFGPGPTNDLVGSEGFTVRTVNNIAIDIRHGPSRTNDAVGCDGWLAKRLGVRC